MVLFLFLLAPLLRLVLKPTIWLLALHLVGRGPGYLWRLAEPGASEESIQLLNALLGAPLVILFVLATVRRLMPRRRRRSRRSGRRAWVRPSELAAGSHPMVYPCPHCGSAHHP